MILMLMNLMWRNRRRGGGRGVSRSVCRQERRDNGRVDYFVGLVMGAEQMATIHAE